MGLDRAPYWNNGDTNLVGNWDIAQLCHQLWDPPSDREEMEYPPNQRQRLVPMAGKYACQYACILHQNVVLHDKAIILLGSDSFISLETVNLKAKYAMFPTERSQATTANEVKRLYPYCTWHSRLFWVYQTNLLARQLLPCYSSAGYNCSPRKTRSCVYLRGCLAPYLSENPYLLHLTVC